MKWKWGIAIMVCFDVCLVICGIGWKSPRATGPSRYTVTTNQTSTAIYWAGKMVHTSTDMQTVAVAPDGQSVAWVVELFVGYYAPDAARDPIYGGTLYVAYGGGSPRKVKEVTKSRGWELPEEPKPNLAGRLLKHVLAVFQKESQVSFVDSTTYHPWKLRWDSTGESLYFVTHPWYTRDMLWQLKRGTDTPRAIVPMADYRLLRQKQGADWVEAWETNYEAYDPDTGANVRDWETTYIYTTEEMAADEYVRPSRKGKASDAGFQ